MANKIMLNIGCGYDIREGYVNIDYVWHTGVNLVMDLNKDCLPFSDCSVDRIVCSHILEHLVNPYDMVRECHRVLKKDGEFLVSLPCYSRGVAHMRYSHNESYFDDICEKDNPNRRSFQQEVMFSKVCVKHNGFTLKKFFWIVVNFFRCCFFYEYEYKLKKM